MDSVKTAVHEVAGATVPCLSCLTAGRVRVQIRTGLSEDQRMKT